MGCGADAEQSDRRAPRWQISLQGLIGLVLAAGIAAGVVRSARGVWGNRLIQPAVSGSARAAAAPAGWSPVPIERTAGLVLEVEAVGFLLILARQLATLLRSQLIRTVAQVPALLFSIAWRLAATVMLLWFLALETRVLRLDYLSELEAAQRLPAWGWSYRINQGLLPISAILVMLGLALGMGAGAVFAEPIARRRRPWWLLVPLAAIVALLLAGTQYVAVIPNLILVALEAVTNAMRHRLVAGPGLAARLLRAGACAFFSLAFILPLALAVARDFELARRKEPWAETWQGWVFRLLLLLAAIGAALYLALVTLPAIHPRLAEGFGYVLGISPILTVVTGFAIFSSGLAAQSIDQSPTREQPRLVRRLATMLRWAVLGLVLLSALNCLPQASQLDSSTPFLFTYACDLVSRLNAWLWSWVPDAVVIVISPSLAPEQLIWTLVVAGVGTLLLELAVRTGSPEKAPFDQLIVSPQTLVRFAWLVVALTCVCLAALPTLFIAGQAIWHIRLGAVQW
jgi:hypothetical protein